MVVPQDACSFPGHQWALLLAAHGHFGLAIDSKEGPAVLGPALTYADDNPTMALAGRW